jgi:hypothetical protein
MGQGVAYPFGIKAMVSLELTPSHVLEREARADRLASTAMAV